MKFILITLTLLAVGAAAHAQETGPTDTGTDGSAPNVAPDEGAERVLTPQDATEVTLEDFKWLNRPIVVFADTPADPRFQEQLDLLLTRQDELLLRDVVLIVDTDPRAASEIRRKLRPRGFMLTLIAKDGRVNLRKPFPWDVREISRAIDKMPIRQQEIRDAKLRAAAGE